MGLCNAFALCLSGAYATFFLITGVGLVSYGAFTAYSILITNSEEIVKQYVTILPSAITILFGLVLVLLVIVGCCGICKESKYCLESYASFLILLAFSQLAFGGYCVIAYGNESYSRNLSAKINSDIETSVRHYTDNSEKMDAIQNWMKCCGHRNSANEHNFYRGQLPQGSELPLSCCGWSAVTCNFHSKELYSDGCAEKVSQFTILSNYFMGWISIVVGVTEELGYIKVFKLLVQWLTTATPRPKSVAFLFMGAYEIMQMASLWFIAALLGICLSCCIWRNQMGSWR